MSMPFLQSSRKLRVPESTATLVVEQARTTKHMMQGSLRGAAAPGSTNKQVTAQPTTMSAM